ncbi:tryptophan--tRNA ligase [Candidatus Uhrbacteria bacterium CG10_big_fil_rev_8_21_14_0_10_50_16]|uniref:Tryptophan--tRNA ligase n=1 Tax=Candidatus Uhrbacteria bacterium CG10_big_fil_rev_8_21_14_0_10_50_16 TaxID=1975039 RepID=A0A2H0RM00_9BACT|nr:MAG: tryptophan--tRNA ligase [Candidatus Uhrbacteria bacterium CG10_big_fil_rev_8_21_14_0_10_50_16]
MTDFLTGIRPTNLLHIGNYFGSVKQLVDFQVNYNGVVMIVDYHAMDTESDPALLRKNILALAATYLAAGINVEQNILFQQSAVSEHTELAWIFSTLMRMSEIERMTQYKDKAIMQGENVPVALFTYPILMAADILLYDARMVPVGYDQKQHVELARTIAERFNRIYGETFHVPEVKLKEVGAKILGLDDPTKKMSKSANSEKNYISLMDSSDVIHKKIMSAVTDDKGAINYSDDQPGIKNLIDIYSLASDQTTEQILQAYQGKGYGDLKKDTAAALIGYLSPLQKRIGEYLADEAELIRVLDAGAARAREIAAAKMAIVRKKVGVSLK